jgi:hypothetical protein
VPILSLSICSYFSCLFKFVFLPPGTELVSSSSADLYPFAERQSYLLAILISNTIASALCMLHLFLILLGVFVFEANRAEIVGTAMAC